MTTRTSESGNTHLSLHTHTHTRIYIYIYICVCVCKICIRVCIYIYIYIYVYIYIHIHIYGERDRWDLEVQDFKTSGARFSHTCSCCCCCCGHCCCYYGTTAVVAILANLIVTRNQHFKLGVCYSNSSIRNHGHGRLHQCPSPPSVTCHPKLHSYVALPC